jgi:prepilin-type N-terminal cleavage/methylation domain-containing protein
MQWKSDCGRERLRAGFTLVELMVVLAIIVLLVALAASATVRFIGQQQINNTETTIRKAMGILKKQWDVVVAEADKEDVANKFPNAFNDLSTIAGSGNDSRLRVIYKQFRLKREFPTNFQEAVNPFPLPPNPTYVKTLRNAGIDPTKLPAYKPYEGAICLLMALQQARGGVALSADDLKGGIVVEISLGNGSTLPGLVDAWGTPLGFYRWPTPTTADPNGPASEVNNLSPASSRNRDPLDPGGLLLNQTWWQSNAALFEKYGHSVSSADGKSPNAYHLIPVIVSAGPDKQMGFAAPTGSGSDPMQRSANQSLSDDNIYSFRFLRQGAIGD